MREIVLGRRELHILRVSVVVRCVRCDLAAQIAVGNIAFGLVVKPLANLVHQDHILPVLHIEACGAHKRKNRALQLPCRIIVFRRERPLRAHRRAVFQRLIGQTPKRSAHAHGGELAACVLIAVRFTTDLYDRSEPRIEHATKMNITGAAAGSDNHAFARPQLHRLLEAFNIALRTKAL